MDKILLGGLNARQFLKAHWQKTPRMIQGAIPDFVPPVSVAETLILARREEMESRLITQTPQTSAWSLKHGPFTTRQLNAAKQHAWTVLVQGVNTASREADALLRRFNALPYARLDDLMVSVAGKRGGVGPHVDSYDVFLLQASGKRRWRISAQTDHRLVEGAPLKILRNFKAQQEFVLAPGDMLYLPPGWAHEGVALTDDCMTYSIGFRALSKSEITRHVLNALDEALPTNSPLYSDPVLRRSKFPGLIASDFLDQAFKLVGRIKFDRALLANALGLALTEPKPHIVFDMPEKPLSERVFKARAAKLGVTLDLKTLLLYRTTALYINGEVLKAPRDSLLALQTLANERSLPAQTLRRPHAFLCRTLHEWYCAGWLHLEEPIDE